MILPIPRPIPDEQDRFERDVIFGMMKLLESVKDAGYRDWQSLTSFLANILTDQDNPTSGRMIRPAWQSAWADLTRGAKTCLYRSFRPTWLPQRGWRHGSGASCSTSRNRIASRAREDADFQGFPAFNLSPAQRICSSVASRIALMKA